jgi:hypothetical protein
VQVVLQNQSRHRPPKLFPVRKIPLQCRPQVRVVVRLVVDDQQQLETIEQKVTAAAARVEDAQQTRIALFTFHVFTFHAITHYVITFHEIPALLGQDGISPPHLPPQPAQCVIGQEGHHVARRVELVAEGQFVAVARCAGGLARLFAQFGRGEILVDPADGLVLAPHRLQRRVVEQVQHLPQTRLAGEEDRGGQRPVKEHA